MGRLFIVGAAKCGTTSLYNYLKGHPELYFSLVKEPNYFSKVYPLTNSEKIRPKKGKEYHSKVITDKFVYDSLFDDANLVQHKYLCECSTSYLFDKDSARLIKATYPDAKIIVMLRNPVHRAFSHYKMYLNSGVEKNENFLNALISDYQKKEKVLGRDFAYIDIGMYYKQLSRYYHEFDSSQIKIVIFEEFIKNVPQALLEIGHFLGISTTYFKEMKFGKTHNESLKPKNNFIKFLVILKNKFYYLFDFMPNSIKYRLKSFLLVKDSDKTINPKAVAYINDILHEDLMSLKEYLSEKEMDQLMN